MFEFKTGTAPTRAVVPEVGIDEDGANGDMAVEEDIDWGDLDLDVADGK